MAEDSKKYDFDMEQGSDFSKKLTFYTDDTKTTPIDLSSDTFKMEMRETVDCDDVLLEISNDEGTVDMTDAATGIIILTATAAVTEALDFDKAVYDLERTNGTLISKVMFGTVTLKKEVTR